MIGIKISLLSILEKSQYETVLKQNFGKKFHIK